MVSPARSIPVALLDVLTRRSGFFLLALVLGFAGLSYVGGLRARHQWGGAHPHALPSAPTEPDGTVLPPDVEPPAPPATPPRPTNARSDRRPRGYNVVTMDLELRPIVPDELPAYKRTDEYGFGYRHERRAEQRRAGPNAELDRTVAAFDGDEIVGTGRNYSLELTLPGGASIPRVGRELDLGPADAPAPRHPAPR